MKKHTRYATDPKTASVQKPTVAIIAFSDPKLDPRVARQISALSNIYSLHVYAFATHELSSTGVTIHDIRPSAQLNENTGSNNKEITLKFPYTLKYSKNPYANLTYIMMRTAFRMMRAAFRMMRTAFRAFKLLVLVVAQKTQWAQNIFMRRLLQTAEAQHLLKNICKLSPALVIANDLEALAILTEGTRYSGKILFDAHEYAPREFEDILSWRLENKWFRTYLCAKTLPRVDLMTTICDGIAREYEKNFHLHQPAVVITNAPAYQKLKPVPPNGCIKLIHHGGAIPSRKLENMIATMALLPPDRFDLTLMLVYSNEVYMNRLRRLAENLNQKVKRTVVKFVPPVPMPEISRYINQYDLELIMVPPVNFNYEMGLGNKFFEAIQARIGLAIGPLPEMVKYVNRYDIGIVANTFSPASMAAALKKVSSADIIRFKNNTNRAAKDNCAEQNATILRHEVAKLLNTEQT
jgi:hypothetical protein